MANGNKTTEKRGGFFKLAGRLAVAAATVYLVVSFVSGQYQVQQMQRQLDDLNIELNGLADENTELQRIVDSGDAEAYIEKVAREMGYARPDERLYVDITGQ